MFVFRGLLGLGLVVLRSCLDTCCMCFVLAFRFCFCWICFLQLSLLDCVFVFLVGWLLLLFGLFVLLSWCALLACLGGHWYSHFGVCVLFGAFSFLICSFRLSYWFSHLVDCLLSCCFGSFSGCFHLLWVCLVIV